MVDDWHILSFQGKRTNARAPMGARILPLFNQNNGKPESFNSWARFIINKDGVLHASTLVNPPGPDRPTQPCKVQLSTGYVFCGIGTQEWNNEPARP
jgi:hypothetical protein